MYIVSIASTSPDIPAKVVLSIEKFCLAPAKVVLSIEKFCLVAHAFERILLKSKGKSSDAVCAVLYEAYRQTLVSEDQFACIPHKD